ncbi:PREDICTED: transcription factor bHLH118-like [Nicotiana attenuata]|uniref:Transcription factor bhlh120 n=1 Tax=Nicotiana attenuata TaxID=49451 RepID=A0A1J6KD88_NICAT|nr:PREDICTED: transcription factor bHLH118-like [Nicotiana attenuata]XP_019234532.1 PREDICTED: transcription factor bHLH118-like [Nicotiana attenuata]XP_019234533.1 PREDICTED: transcription factor bHLH118-like [Nicotiana attenuata]XP_019234535.1 PREDICTED: transcription factor bHLH118-like [Nicotiana attenuata]OIT26684.1 transcription factor bhlh120 [Nicotiana attenuata]
MYSLQENDELVFQILSNPCQQSKVSQDLVMDYASLETRTHHDPLNIYNSQVNKRLPKRILGTTDNNIPDHKKDETAAAPAPPDDFKLRRIIHRDIERQRRREMSALYSSLRSLLPLQYVKGKRSVSDHMHEAVNYIKEMQANIKELEKRRELLIKSSLPNSIRNGNYRSNNFTDCVTVSPCLQGGIEILISVDCKAQSFPLSRVLRELLKQGINAVSCVSAKVNQRSLYTIQIEVCDMNKIDHQALQQKVIDLINVDL